MSVDKPSALFEQENPEQTAVIPDPLVAIEPAPVKSKWEQMKESLFIEITDMKAIVMKVDPERLERFSFATDIYVKMLSPETKAKVDDVLNKHKWNFDSVEVMGTMVFYTACSPDGTQRMFDKPEQLAALIKEDGVNRVFLDAVSRQACMLNNYYRMSRQEMVKNLGETTN